MGSVRRDRRIATHPRNPWDKDTLVKELQLMGTHGLKNKRELWTILTTAKSDKKKARTLLITTDEHEFMIHGRALLNKLVKDGLISSVDFNDADDIRRALKEVLNFDLNHYLERRLQYQVFKSGIARNVHHARCMIYKGQICVKGRVVKTPSFVVKSEDQGLIEKNPILANRKKSKATGEEPQEE
jgi:small subunit ribosomal protein S9e